MATAAEIKARIKAITTCDEAKGREAMADHLAFKTELSADQARRALALAPPGLPSASDQAAAYAARKADEGALGLGTGCPIAPVGGGGSLAELKADRIRTSWSKAVAAANAKISATAADTSNASEAVH